MSQSGPSQSGPAVVFHLDDDPDVLVLCRMLLAEHWPAATPVIKSFSDPAAMTAAAHREAPDLVLFDYRLGEALTAAPYIAPLKRASPKSVVIVLSELTSTETIRDAFAAEADDYVARSGEPKILAQLIFKAFQLVCRRRFGQVPLPVAPAGAGKTMQQVAGRVARLMTSAVSGVHVYGESGTGKEIVADLFRQHAGTAPFVVVNCAALAPSLVEAELFGAVRGAYTGAVSDRRGVFEAAHRGWLFLDEVACLPLPAQAALLRAIENQEIVRIGDTKVIKVNVRILSATNEHLKSLVEAGMFRRDLWQRLCETTIHLPSLAARRDEIPELIDFLAQRLPGGPYQVAPMAKRLLSELAWSDGNVRELRNCLRAMTEHDAGGILCPQAIPAGYLRPTSPTPPQDRGRWNWQVQAFDVAVTHLTESYGPLSVRQLATHLGMSKSAVARRLKVALCSRQPVTKVGVLDVHNEA